MKLKFGDVWEGKDGSARLMVVGPIDKRRTTDDPDDLALLVLYDSYDPDSAGVVTYMRRRLLLVHYRPLA